MPADVTQSTIAQLAELICRRELSPVELTQAYLARIERFDRFVHAYIQVFADEALATARVAEAEIAAGAWRGPMHGIPVALKDNIAAREGFTTCHSALMKTNRTDYDAFAVARLRAAGAIVLGKLAMWEFATGGGSLDTPWPPARNPWNTEFSANGSSSGAAVAVAAGMCAAALGTDTGGSLRNPAAWCGVVGMKPTYGLVSRGGVVPLSFSLDHVGPVGWTAPDCAAVLDAIAGYDPADPSSVAETIADPAAAFRGLRVGYVAHYLQDGAGVEPEMASAVAASRDVLRDAGAIVSDVRLPALREYQDVGLQIARSEAYAVHEDTLRSNPELYGTMSRRRLLMGAFIPASCYVNAQRDRMRLTSDLREMMRDIDILLLPMARSAARAFGDDVLGASGPFLGRPFNISGTPAASVCAGFSRAGLPLAVQIAGRPFEDKLVLAAGALIENALGLRTRRPDLSAASHRKIA